MNGTGKRLRDLFFLAAGTAILFNQFWQREEPSALGVLVALLLIGFIPASRADETLSSGPIALLLRALGLKVERVNPEPLEAAPEERAAPAALEDRAAEPGAVEDRADAAGHPPHRSSPPESSEPD